MSQNTSSAVMQQRSEPHDSLDDFPTPPWATRAICEWLASQGLISRDMTVREPCANRGYMVRPLLEFFDTVEASDVHDYGLGYEVRDFLFGPDLEMVDATFQNPPFKLAQQFIERALKTSRKLVVVIVRSAFTEGIARYEELFANSPPHFVLQHVERVPMCKGRYDPNIASATAYSWLVWIPGERADTRYRWIAPCRRRLERRDDVVDFTSEAA
jgi:hypothetical protein